MHLHHKTVASDSARLALGAGLTLDDNGAVVRQGSDYWIARVSASGVRWVNLSQPLDDVWCSLRALQGNSNNVITSFGLIPTTSFGALTTRAQTTTSPASMLLRTAVQTAGTAGALGVYRAAGSLPYASAGFRYVFRGVLGAISSSMRWFQGISATLPSASVDPSAFTDCLGIGRGAGGEANVQLFHNDASGAATQIDLGASFPANAANEGYELEILTLTGAEYYYRVMNLNSRAETNGVLVSNIPTATTQAYWMFASSNGADAVAVSLDVSEMTLQLRR